MKLYSDFTKAELHAIADKIKAANIDGKAFRKIAIDADGLVKYASVSIGYALHFSR